MPVTPEALRFYNLGDLCSVNPVPAGFANESYRIGTTGGMFLYRIFHQQGMREIMFELRVMDILGAHSFPTAYPIARCDGSYVTSTKEGPVVIYEFIEGEHPLPDRNSVKQVSRILATLNKLPVPSSLQKKNAVHIDECLKITGEFRHARCQYPDIFKYFEEQTTYLEPFLRPALPEGIVHGDAFPENILSRNKKLAALVDFEEACTDHLLFDVGIGMNAFCFIRNKPDASLMKLFLKEYRAVREISEIEREALPYYIQWGAHGMILWHLRHLLNRRHTLQEARVRELLTRVQYMRKHKPQF